MADKIKDTDIEKSLKHYLIEMLKIRSDRESKTREKEMAKYLNEIFQECGWRTEIFEIAYNRCGVIGKLGEGEAKFGVITHIDTVSSYFEPYIKDDVIFGRGACDTKGIIAAICLLSSIYEPENYQLIFIGLPGEESDQIGSKNIGRILKEKKISNLKYVIVAEPTNFTPGKSTNGWGGFVIEYKFEQSHSSDSLKSENTNLILRELLEAEKYNFRILGISTTPNKLGVTPEKLTIKIEWRGKKEEEYLKGKRKIFESISSIKDRCKSVEITELPYTPPYSLEEDYNKTLFSKIFPEAYELDISSDAGYIYNHGIKCIVFGPGNPYVAHTSREHISIKELKKGMEEFEEILKKVDKNILVYTEGEKICLLQNTL